MIGSSMDFLNDIHSHCLGGSYECIEQGKRACEAIGNECWGFTLHNVLGVQMYTSEAFDSGCPGTGGLTPEAGFTTYIKHCYQSAHECNPTQCPFQLTCRDGSCPSIGTDQFWYGCQDLDDVKYCPSAGTDQTVMCQNGSCQNSEADCAIYGGVKYSAEPCPCNPNDSCKNGLVCIDDQCGDKGDWGACGSAENRKYCPYAASEIPTMMCNDGSCEQDTDGCESHDGVRYHSQMCGFDCHGDCFEDGQITESDCISIYQWYSDHATEHNYPWKNVVTYLRYQWNLDIEGMTPAQVQERFLAHCQGKKGLNFSG